MSNLFFNQLELKEFASLLSDRITKGVDHIHLRPDNAFASSLAESLHEFSPGTTVTTADDAGGAACEVICSDDAPYVSSALMNYVDVMSTDILAPITDHLWSNRSLFLISIPKSGTHLLYALAEAFGFAAGVICPENPKPGCWYCVEYSNSHTVARDFFVDGVRRAPFGNRSHPFMSNPALFIYRNPLDILISEANYYHKDTSSPFYSYLSRRSFEERLKLLIDDPWLLGNIRDRIGGFIPWIQIDNVIPMSFEELIGGNGGGNDQDQQRLIWSLQLKLHVPGTPEAFGARLFDPDSPTFHEGQIGAHREHMTQDALDAFKALPQDFMDALGYSNDNGALPSHAAELRRRPLLCSSATFSGVSYLLERDFMGHSLLRYSGRTYAVPEGNGPLDLEIMTEDELGYFFNAPTTTEVKTIVASTTYLGHRILPDGDRFIAVPSDTSFSRAKELTDDERTLLPTAPSIDAMKQILTKKMILDQAVLNPRLRAVLRKICNALFRRK